MPPDLTGLPWKERAKRHRQEQMVFRPPGVFISLLLWHIVDTHRGRKRLQWRPGIGVWKDEDGARWTEEAAGELRWQYVNPAEDAPDGNL